MKNRIEIYKTWAPDDALWTNWAKPVLFATMEPNNSILKTKDIKWDIKFNYSTAIILDLPNDEAVFEGIELAKLGYRPIPLYNGVKGSSSKSDVINVTNIEKALYVSTPILEQLTLKKDAPPVFLLDSNRLNGFSKQRNRFDNRWSIFPQDMPSALYLKNQGIKNIIVRTNKIATDLTHILLRYQEQQIIIYHCDDNNNITEVKIKKPSYYKGLFHRFSVLVGLTANSAGGFGGVIPDQTSGGLG